MLKAITLHEIRTGASQQPLAPIEDDGLRPREESIEPELSAGIAPENIPLLERMLRLGHMSANEAAIFWGTPRTSTHRRLKQLERAGLIVRKGNSRSSRFHPTEAARRHFGTNGTYRAGQNRRHPGERGLNPCAVWNEMPPLSSFRWATLTQLRKLILTASIWKFRHSHEPFNTKIFYRDW
jgi:hypothetical protein